MTTRINTSLYFLILKRGASLECDSLLIGLLASGSRRSSDAGVAQVEKQAAFCVAQGNDVALLQGTTGEWPSLTLPERVALATEWRRCVPVTMGHAVVLRNSLHVLSMNPS